MLMNYKRRNFLIGFLFFLIMIDFGSDSINRSLPFDFSVIKNIFDYIIAILTLIIAITSPIKIPSKSFISVPYYLFLCIYGVGFFSGLVSNDVQNVFAEFSVILFFILGYSITSNISREDISRLIDCLMLMFVIIMALKLIFYICITKYFDGVVSWKILMKQSPLLLMATAYYLMQKKIAIFKLLILQICLILSASRGLIISEIIMVVMCATLYQLKLIFFLPLLLLALILLYLVIYYLVVSNGIDMVSDYLIFGEKAADSVAFRAEQFAEISQRLSNNLWFGTGFGYTNPDYLDYYLLSKPYLLELDFLNFMSKVGLIGIFLYFIFLLIIIYLAKFRVTIKNKHIVMTLVISLISILLYSFSQTFISSYLYPLLVGCILAVISKLSITSNTYYKNNKL